MKKASSLKIEKFPAAKQRRLDELLDKNSEGSITRKEKARLVQLVAEAERLMAANAKRFAKFTGSSGKRPPSGAVPVTIWLQPEHTER